MLIVEKPVKGQIILTDEIRLKGIVFSFPLNRPGIFNVTPSWSMIILEGKILLPAVRRDAMKVSIENWALGLKFFIVFYFVIFICRKEKSIGVK